MYNTNTNYNKNFNGILLPNQNTNNMHALPQQNNNFTYNIDPNNYENMTHQTQQHPNNTMLTSTTVNLKSPDQDFSNNYYQSTQTVSLPKFQLLYHVQPQLQQFQSRNLIETLNNKKQSILPQNTVVVNKDHKNYREYQLMPINNNNAATVTSTNPSSFIKKNFSGPFHLIKKYVSEIR